MSDFNASSALSARPQAQILLTDDERCAELFPALLVVPLNGTTSWADFAGRHCVLYPLDRQRAIDLHDAGALSVKGITATIPDDLTAKTALQWAKQHIEPILAAQAGESPTGQEPADSLSLPPSSLPEPVAAVLSPEDEIRVNAYLDLAKQGRIKTFAEIRAEAETVGNTTNALERAISGEQTMPDGRPLPPRESAYQRPRRAKKPDLTVVGNAVRHLHPEDDPDMPQAHSEDALAESFTAGPGQEWKSCPAWGAWFRWDGSRWAEDVTKKITFEVRIQLRKMATDAQGDVTLAGRQKIVTLKTATSVIGLCNADPRHSTAPDDWDKDTMLLGVPGGVIDLRIGKLLESDRDHLISKQTLCAPERGPHPHWDMILDRACKGDAALRGFIQRWCGYILTGDTREERFLFVHGPGGGGKSKFLEPLSAILHDYRKTTSMEAFMAQRNPAHSEEIARLAGARLVTASETEESGRWNESRIKQLTGRDVVAARHMHRSTFEFMPQFKLIFVGNHKPALRSVGEEMRRRIDLLEWADSIPESQRIYDLPQRLQAEYPAILQWMIDGCMEWQRVGLGKVSYITDAVENYLSTEDSLGTWLEECCIVADEQEGSAALYSSFKLWAEKNGEFCPSSRRFGQQLENRGFLRYRSSTERGFNGLRLRLPMA